MTFEIAPLRRLGFAPEGTGPVESLVSPPYDIIDSDEHRALLEKSPYNVTHLTLGKNPGEKEDYRSRGERILDWKKRGVLVEDASPGLYVYGCDYTVPGSTAQARFRGLIGLGKLHPFEERVVLPHEETFPRVVDDRFRLLEATRTQLELIFLLYEDPDRSIDDVLEAQASGPALMEVEAKPGERHSLWKIGDPEVVRQLQSSFRSQRPIIADGHHRYTTSLLYREQMRDHPEAQSGSEWQPMVFANLVGDGLSILATHRLVDTRGNAEPLLRLLDGKFERLEDGSDNWDYSVERTGGDVSLYRVSDSFRAERSGVAATDYGILESEILGSWLPSVGGSGTGVTDYPVSYFKEGTGENEALETGQGDLLFRMRPVSPGEFRSVLEAGEVYPHKTTFFYPKLWSGMLFWSLRDPD